MLGDSETDWNIPWVMYEWHTMIPNPHIRGLEWILCLKGSITLNIITFIFFAGELFPPVQCRYLYQSCM